MNLKSAQLAGMGYDACITLSESRGYDATREKACLDKMDSDIHRYNASWGDYWGALLASTILCVVVYGFLWILAAIAKWVWRGRLIG